MLLKIVQPPSPPYLKKYGQSLCLQFYDGRNPLFHVREYLVLESPYSQGHPMRNFDEILLFLGHRNLIKNKTQTAVINILNLHIMT